MSIYDNLANSDYIDSNNIREQLKKMSQVQESQESDIGMKADPHTQENMMNTNDSEQPNMGMNEDSIKRQNILQGVDRPNVDRNLNFLNQAKQASQGRAQFEQATRMRESIEGDDLLDDSSYQEDNHRRKPSNPFPQAKDQVDFLKEQRNKMIFDDNLEMSEKRPNLDRENDVTHHQNKQYGRSAMNEEEVKGTRNEQVDGNGPNTPNDCHFTLNKYESRPELMKKTGQTFAEQESQMETAHFKKQGGGPGTLNSDHPRTETDGTQKTENPDRDQMLIDQRGFQAHAVQDSVQLEDEGTGQFGGNSKWQQNNMKNVHVGQFQEDQNQLNGDQSPKINGAKGSQDDQISKLLAQLQAPMGMDTPAGMIKGNYSGADTDQMKYEQLENAHKQMQESIKLMKLVDDPVNIAANDSATDPGSIGQGGIGFNGQNSLYDIAQRVGQPLSSSNLNSMSNYDNVEDFQKFLQGEGSIGSGTTNPYGKTNQLSENPTTQANQNYHNLNLHMQDSQGSQENAMSQPYPKQAYDRQKSNAALMGANNQIFKNAAQNVLLNEKENFNDKNMNYQQYHQFEDRNRHMGQMQSHQMPHAQDIVPNSLAARAALAKQRSQQDQIPQQRPQIASQGVYNHIGQNYNQMQNQQDQGNYRKKFDPAALMNQNTQNVNLYQPQKHDQRPSLTGGRHSNLDNNQQYPYQGQNVDFSKTNRDDKVQKRKALLAQFDDIPIHQIHKMDGYQIRNIDDEEQTPGISARPNNNPYGNEGFDKTDENLENLSLKDQIFHPKWKVRMNAFKAINQQFISYKGPQKELVKEDEMYGDPDNPFDQYGPMLEQMIKDSNLTAQFEGLNCLFSFVKYAQDIKSVSFSCHSYLLDKIQHNKPNLRDISQRILLIMLQKKENIVPEILKRFKSKNSKVIQFCLDLVNGAFVGGELQAQDVNLKMLFKSSHDLLGHSIKETRDSAIQLITFVYEHCEDDLNTFCSNLTGLRPVQLKELKDQLSSHQKDQTSEYLVKIFDKSAAADPARKEAEKSPVNRSKSVDSHKNKPEQRDAQDEDGQELSQTDLTSLTPENFNEIPYLSAINVKRKTMESFNQELTKLVQKQQQQISAFDGGDQLSVVKLTKDYSPIINIVIHMLEDPNMLVFIEAIKMVEYLAILLKQTIKGPKMRQLIQVCADKYKETKTAVLTALEKTFDAIFENRCVPLTSLFDQLINQISLSHKNPRVKQMVIDRVELLIQKNYMNDLGRQKNPQQLLQIFKQVKDKLKQIILKDTNANVRDAGVSLLAQFRIILGTEGNFEDFQPVLEIINQLPKQRVSEISKRLEIYEQQVASQNEGQYSSRNIHEDRKSARDRSRGQSAKSGVRGQSQKTNERGPASNKNLQVAGDHAQSQDQLPQPSPSPIKADKNGGFLFQTKRAQMNISNQYQASLSDIILTIKNISQDKDRLRSNQIAQNFEQGLEELGDDGIKECKGQIVACIYWLLTNHLQKVNFFDQERQVALKSIVTLLKKLYCIERSFGEAGQIESGYPQELYHVVNAALICFALLQDTKIIVQLLNIVYVAVSSQGHLLDVLKDSMTNLVPFPKSIVSGKALALSNAVYFISDKISSVMKKSEGEDVAIDLREFEDFRSIVIQQVENTPDDNDKQILIQSLIYLKDKIQEYEGGPSGQVQSANGEYQQNYQVSPDRSEFEEEDTSIPKYQQVMEMINENFEQGLLKLKELVKEEQSGTLIVSFEQKEQIVNLLLSLTTSGYKNPQEQCKQAYSLKALMWLKEEFIGLEETFKLTNPIMDCFYQAVIDGRDSSIEQYLLNFWTKSLSLRDTVDRIQISTRLAQESKEEVFNVLFTWLFNLKISPDNQNGNQLAVADWVLEDFRKIAPMLARGVFQRNQANESGVETIWKFFEVSSDKFGAKKVRDFMEIQLIHENDLLIKFLDVFDGKFGLSQIRQSNNTDLDKGKTNKDEGRESQQTLQEPLLTGRSGNGSNVGVTDRQTLLREMRDRRKEQQNAEKELSRASGSAEIDFSATLAEEKKRYEEIMQRLDNYKSGKREENNSQQENDQRVQIENVDNVDKFSLKNRDGRVSNMSKERVNTQDNQSQNNQLPPQTAMSRASNSSHRYATQNMRRDGTQQSLEEFNEDEDFKLSTDYQNSIVQLPGTGSAQGMQGNDSLKMNIVNSNRGDVNENDDNKMFMKDRINMQKNGERARSFRRDGSFGEGLHNEEKIFLNQNSEQELQESRRKLRESVNNQEERLQRLESSQIKVRHYRNELQTLEEQKKQLEQEKVQLLSEQNRESEQWKARYADLTTKNDEIVANLAEANKCYMRQVSENEKLARQIQELQEQHREFVQKYKEMEQRLEDSERQVEEQKTKLVEESQKSNLSPQRTDRSKFAQDQVIEEQQLQKIGQAFDKGQVMQYGVDRPGMIGVRKIQELLLDNEETRKDLSKPMIIHYQRLRSKVDRMEMMQALKQSLENEDILFAINQEVYKSLLNFLLRAFSFEKELIERESLQQQHERECQNELTQESQRLVSKLLNSKEFTCSLIALLQLLKSEAMPDDFSTHLSIQERQYLRVIMRCVSRIVKALHSENPDLVRAFDVLLEMQKLFVRHPPENLRQDLPCLQDFDFVYRGLKDVSDKLIELHPQKCVSFLEFSDQGSESTTSESDRESAADGQRPPDNAFIKYLRQMIQIQKSSQY